ncbi:MAG TPA: hypothetical protein VFM54_18275 [Micromonosporaceae bacterium]|nr:hypothetical protein [Micromonosporaceae bacterium]
MTGRKDATNPVSTFLDALRDLHIRAGQPSTRELAQVSRRDLRSAVTQTTIHDALTGHRLPRWEVARVLVILLKGDEEYFQDLWHAAASYITTPAVLPSTQPDAGTGDRPEELPPHRGRGDTVRDGGPEKDHEPVGTSLLLRTGRAGALVGRDTLAFRYTGPDGPPVIQLLRAAARDGRDLNRLLIDVVFNDPVGSSPMVAFIAENDLAGAVDLVASLAKDEQSYARYLLQDMAVGQPKHAAAVIGSLVGDPDVPPQCLLPPVFELCRSTEHAPLAGRVLVACLQRGDLDETATELVTRVRENLRDAPVLGRVVAAALREGEALAGVGGFLDHLVTVDQPVAGRVFLHSVYDTAARQSYRDPAHHTMLGITARCSRLCVVMILAYALTEQPDQSPKDRLDLLCQMFLDLAEEDLNVAARLTTTMGALRPLTTMRITAQIARRHVEVAGALMLVMAGRDLRVPATLLGTWFRTSFPDAAVPPGTTVRRMVGLDPVTTAKVLDMVLGTGDPDTSHLTGGLDTRTRREILSGLEPYMTPANRRRLSDLL